MRQLFTQIAWRFREENAQGLTNVCWPDITQESPSITLGLEEMASNYAGTCITFKYYLKYIIFQPYYLLDPMLICP